MQIAYKNDALRGAGNGLLYCQKVKNKDAIADVRLQRSADKNFLAGNGEWQSTLISVALTKEAAGEGAVLFRLPPILVNALNPSDTYRLQLLTHDGEVLEQGQFSVREILYTSEEALQNTLVAENAALDEDREEEPKEEPKEEPLTQATEEPKKHGLLFVSLLLAFLLLAGCVAAYLWFGGKDAPKENGAEEIAKQESGQGAKKEVLLSSEEQVRRFFREERSTKQAVALAKKLSHASVADQDALFRLYYYASENGETALLMAYAKTLDPVYPAWGTIKKNAVEAWKIYEKAKAQDQEALKSQEQLLIWLKKKASMGNGEAREALEVLGK